MDDPASKALSDEYTKITTELDEIKAKQDEVFKNLNQLRDERTRANEAQQVAYTNLKDIKDKYWQAKRAYAEYEKEAYRVRRERQKAERDAYEAGKRKQVAEAKLEEASAPAYGDEIQTAQSLIRYFDPSSQEAKAAAGPGKFAAQASRTVEATGIKGTALPRKGEADEDYMAGNGGKKGKKNRKNQNASPAPEAAATKFNLSFGVIEQLAKIDVQPPSSQAAVAGVVEQIKAKLEGWQKDQARKTQEVSDRPKTPCALFKHANIILRTSTRPRRRLNASRPNPLKTAQTPTESLPTVSLLTLKRPSLTRLPRRTVLHPLCLFLFSDQCFQKLCFQG